LLAGIVWVDSTETAKCLFIPLARLALCPLALAANRSR
jgi:hypothetical protein